MAKVMLPAKPETDGPVVGLGPAPLGSDTFNHKGGLAPAAGAKSQPLAVKPAPAGAKPTGAGRPGHVTGKSKSGKKKPDKVQSKKKAAQKIEIDGSQSSDAEADSSDDEHSTKRIKVKRAAGKKAHKTGDQLMNAFKDLTTQLASLKDVKNEVLKDKPCKFFLKEGKCRYGDACKFSHEQIQPGEKAQEPPPPPNVVQPPKADEEPKPPKTQLWDDTTRAKKDSHVIEWTVKSRPFTTGITVLKCLIFVLFWWFMFDFNTLAFSCWVLVEPMHCIPTENSTAIVPLVPSPLFDHTNDWRDLDVLIRECEVSYYERSCNAIKDDPIGVLFLCCVFFIKSAIQILIPLIIVLLIPRVRFDEVHCYKRVARPSSVPYDDVTKDVRPDLLAKGKLLHTDPLLAYYTYNHSERCCLCVLYYTYVVPDWVFLYWFISREKRVLVSVELLSQLNTFSNTMPTLTEQLASDRLQYAARNICTVNLDRFDFMYGENVVANTVFLAYAIYKRTNASTKSLPFWREPVTQ
jgi:hypothetical protein